MDHDGQTRLGGQDTRPSVSAPGAGALAFDAERYRQHVEHLEMSQDRKDELLAAVWQIMRSFVDLAFGDDAAQLARNSGDSRAVMREASGSGAVGLSHTPQPDNRAGLARVFRQCGEGD
ncbi:hypothetical protein IQ270_29015 [Microcoleus sp. LEGE 07076]|uniref:hypothetical protein n=1 Tax=Microcoleus sp. LEGE 07076 TaxID=915322 RepID=UPI0018812778|nr:hypothetical protein [Microcoleus sp. LEGE 07076]MBE9188567.1 hypothetical protein [Microcoleus sp. LEGE 07076]